MTIYPDKPAPSGPIILGQASEDNFAPRAITIDWSAWQEIYPDAVLSVIVARPDGESYPAVENSADCPLIWTPSETDTAVPGAGLLEIVLTATGTTGKSIDYPTLVRRSVTGGPVPDPAPSWYQQTLTARDEAVEAAEHYPYIDPDTATWWTWDVEAGEFVNTGMTARGDLSEGDVSDLITASNLTFSVKLAKRHGSAILFTVRATATEDIAVTNGVFVLGAGIRPPENLIVPAVVGTSPVLLTVRTNGVVTCSEPIAQGAELFVSGLYLQQA